MAKPLGRTACFCIQAWDGPWLSLLFSVWAIWNEALAGNPLYPYMAVFRKAVDSRAVAAAMAAVVLRTIRWSSSTWLAAGSPGVLGT